MMNPYWLYDIPSWAFASIVIGFFVSFSLLEPYFLNHYFQKKLLITRENNEAIAAFLSISGVFYGITLGLIAVGTFENFNTTESVVTGESSSLAALYRDVSILESPQKDSLKATLKNYTNYVVNKAWKQQQQGIIPKGGTLIIDQFQKQLSKYQPVSKKDEIIYAEVFDQFNVLVEKRRLRLNSVNASLPATIWYILIMGAMINIAMTWLLVFDNKKLSVTINILSGLLIGTIIFLIAAMDNPYRGEYSVSADSFRMLLDGLMK